MNKDNGLFLSLAGVLILVALIFTIGSVFRTPTISFGTCQLKVEIARTDQQKARGLSGRPTIQQDKAMVFPFKKEQPYFWMKDMLTSIDIVWVADGKVVKIDANVPVDDGAKQYQALVPIDWVVEVAPGRSANCGVSEGSEIKGLTP